MNDNVDITMFNKQNMVILMRKHQLSKVCNLQQAEQDRWHIYGYMYVGNKDLVFRTWQEWFTDSNTVLNLDKKVLVMLGSCAKQNVCVKIHLQNEYFIIIANYMMIK